MRLQMVAARAVRAFSFISIVLAAFAAFVVFAPSAVACPSCPTARQVNAIVCGDGVWRNLAMTVAPFVVFAAVGWLLHGLGDSRREHAGPAPVREPDTLAKAEAT